MSAKTKNTRQRVVILGGGFGGVKTALALAENPSFDITLISDQDNFRYYPSLYKTATGGARAASSIALSEIFKDKPVKVIKDTAKMLDRQKQRVVGTSGKTYRYDKLIIGLGVVTNFFGIKGLAKYAYGIKTLEEAQRLRQHLHKQLLDDKQPDINYVVIGAGPTGVELAGALPSYIKHVMKAHGMGDQKLNIDLIEAASRVMPRMPKAYSRAAAKRLRRLGVRIYLKQTVQAETADALVVNAKPLTSHTVVWTAGVTNHPFLKTNGFRLSAHGKVLVDPYLQTEPNIYVIGDNADTPYSGMAQTALYDGHFVAENLKRRVASQSPEIYIPKKPIFITPVGDGWAAVLWNKSHIYGRLGWWLRDAADLAGYHDLEPWWLAAQHWMALTDEAQECQICSTS